MNFPLDSRQLRAFTILAHTGSFTLAAKELHLSQSAVSHSMRALEEQIGCRLLDRMGKKVLLTQAGEQLLFHSEKILHQMSLARTDIEKLGKWGCQKLRLGASTTACQYLLPSVLRKFKDNFPQCVITIEPGDTPQTIESLRSNRIDLALALEPMYEDKLAFRPLFSDELVFLLSPMHPWAQQERVERMEIPRQNYILYNKNSYTFEMVREYFLQEKMELNTVIELGSMEAIKELVKLGLGISILAPWIARRELQEKSLISLPLGKRKLKRQWGLLHWKDRRLNLAEETFISHCGSITDDLHDPTCEQMECG